MTPNNSPGGEETKELNKCAEALLSAILDGEEETISSAVYEILNQHWPRPITPKEEWTSVEERYPLDKQLVITYRPEAVGFKVQSERYSDFPNKTHYDRITHWMPLPSPPTGEQTKKGGE